jgi:WD40 repeat protein
MVHFFPPNRPPAVRRTSGKSLSFAALSFLFILSALLGAHSARAQDRPAIKWMHGGHLLLIHSVLSPDGTILVTEGLDQTVKIRRTSDGVLLRTIADNTFLSHLNALAMSPDGTKIVLGSMASFGDNKLSVRIYRISDGMLLRSWTVSDQVNALAWSPDGTKIAVTTFGVNDIELRSAQDGSLLRTLVGHTSTPAALAFSPDNARLVSGGDTVRLWNTADGSLLRSFPATAGTINSVAFSSDNHTVASIDTQGVLRLQDADTGQLLQSITNVNTSNNNDDLAFSPDGATIASGSNASQVRTWDVATGALLHTATLGPVNTSIGSVLYTANGSQLLAVGFESEFTIYNSADLSVVRSLPKEYTAAPGGVGITPDGAHVVSAGGSSFLGGEPFLQVWNAATGALEQSIANVGRHAYSALAVSPDSTAFATIDQANSAEVDLRVWRISDGTVLLNTDIGVQTSALAWSKDGSRLFHGDRSGTVTIRSAADGSKVGTLPGTSGTVTTLTISPDGNLLAAAYSNNIIGIWRLSDSTLIATLTGHSDTINSLAFTPDSARLLSGSLDTTAILWNLADGSIVRTFSAGLPIPAVAVAPDGQSIAVSAVSTEVLSHLLFWRLSDGSLIGDFTEEAQRVSQLMYSPDNTAIVYARADATVAVAANPALNPFQASLKLAPATLGSGGSTTATLTLAQAAPAGGVTFTLSSSAAFATPSTTSLVVPAGATSATFTVSTTSMLVGGSAILTAASSGYSTSATLNVLAHLASDFNNDGLPDLIFQNQTTNQIALWFTSGLNILGGSVLSSVPQADWKVVGVGDFNRDTNSDLVFQNQTTGQIVIWYMLGTTYLGGEALSFQPASGYKVVGVGDFNGDGKPDILFQQEGTGQLAIWYLQGANVVGGVSIPRIPPASYKVVGVGDLNHDGKQDIVFQDQTNNQVVAWFMNGPQFGSVAPIFPDLPPAPWKVRAVLDLNADGRADLVFQNQTTNQLDAWYMKETGAAIKPLDIIGGGFFSLVPLMDYKLVGPR